MALTTPPVDNSAVALAPAPVLARTASMRLACTTRAAPSPLAPMPRPWSRPMRPLPLTFRFAVVPLVGLPARALSSLPLRLTARITPELLLTSLRLRSVLLIRLMSPLAVSWAARSMLSLPLLASKLMLAALLAPASCRSPLLSCSCRSPPRWAPWTCRAWLLSR